MFLIFDTETTGLPLNYKAPITDTENWPRMVQLAWQVFDIEGNLLDSKDFIIKPNGYTIPAEVTKIHGISTEYALEKGVDIEIALNEFNNALQNVTCVVAHNFDFDKGILGAEYTRSGITPVFLDKTPICTKLSSVEYCALPGKNNGYKWPALSELHIKLFGSNFNEAHNAAADVAATSICFLELIRLGVITEKELSLEPGTLSKLNKSTTPVFTHLHVHTQYSILDGAAHITALIKKAKQNGMTAIAITDHGNMFGVLDFVQKATEADIKAIIGSEVYVSEGSRFEKKGKEDRSGYHLVLLAKNMTGYKNLMKLSSLSFLEGFYYTPRIDKELLTQYSEGLIACSACLAGEIPDHIKTNNLEAAETALKEYLSIFGDDFYLEMQRHGIPEQQTVNEALMQLSKKYNVKIIATNDVHFVNAEEAEEHDLLVCMNTGKDIDDPKRMRYTGEEYLKTHEEMSELFSDIPEAIINTAEIVDKIETLSLDRPPVLPVFPLPEGFSDENEYLRHLTYKGAELYYNEITDIIKERIDYELSIVKNIGYPGYFLIVHDFINAARKSGVIVGPGRGSVTGSIIAFCLGISRIDPIKYNLLFERFLNPERISLPDIDIDFDDDARDKVLKYVVEKYGKKRVAQIVTFGSMGSKSAIRDVARTLKLPLQEADYLAKLVTDKVKNLPEAIKEVPALKDALENGSETVQKTLKFAIKLEGAVRSTGKHACGVIIGPDDLLEYVPLAIAKDSELPVSQYEGTLIESIGMLKMDFLGLKTLSIIRDAIESIKKSQNIIIDIENIPLDDKKTYELFSRADTIAIFQFESEGMRENLRKLKPDQLNDLIVMNALYRPGPMRFIANYINRKHGREEITYPIEDMKEILIDTFGITVYQEQVMMLSQLLAGFTKGEADKLRKAIGKKKPEEMEKMKNEFISKCVENKYDKKICEKIWYDWEDFAGYAFNKSHSAGYALVAYQTAYLKANYPSEFMAAALSRSLNNIKDVSVLMDECKRMGIKVFGPDINESYSTFNVGNDGNIRFGLAAIKGIGSTAVTSIIKERDKNGNYSDIYNLIKRVNLNTVNKKSIEALALSGALDCFGDIKRHQYFAAENNQSFIEGLIRFGNMIQQDSKKMTPSLFGDTTEMDIIKPFPAKCEEWSILHKLEKEKECIGIYLSSHPLDDFKFEIEHLKTTPLSELDNSNLKKLNQKELTLIGLVSSSEEKTTKKGDPYGRFTLEDYSGSYNFVLFSKDYIGLKNFLTKGYYLSVKVKVQESWRGNKNKSNSNDNKEIQPEDKIYEAKIISIMLLSDVRHSVFKTIQIKTPLNYIDNDFINTIEELTSTENGKGKIMLRFIVYDTDKNVSLDLFSRSKKIAITDELINFLKNNTYLEYTVS